MISDWAASWKIYYKKKLSFASSSPTQNTTTLPWSKWHGSTETDQTKGKTLEKAEGLKPTSVHSHCFPVICLNFTFMLVLPRCQSFEWSHVHAYSIPRSVAAKYIPFSGLFYIYIKAPQIPDWTMIRQVWWFSAVISRGGKKNAERLPFQRGWVLPELISLQGIKLQEASLFLFFYPILSLSVGAPFNAKEKSVMYCLRPAAHFSLQISSSAPRQLCVCSDVYMCVLARLFLFPSTPHRSSMCVDCLCPLPPPLLLLKCHFVVTARVMTIYGSFFTGV